MKLKEITYAYPHPESTGSCCLVAGKFKSIKDQVSTDEEFINYEIRQINRDSIYCKEIK